MLNILSPMCKLIQSEIRQRGLAAPARERDQLILCEVFGFGVVEGILWGEFGQRKHNICNMVDLAQEGGRCGSRDHSRMLLFSGKGGAMLRLDSEVMQGSGVGFNDVVICGSAGTEMQLNRYEQTEAVSDSKGVLQAIIGNRNG